MSQFEGEKHRVPANERRLAIEAMQSKATLLAEDVTRNAASAAVRDRNHSGSAEVTIRMESTLDGVESIADMIEALGSLTNIPLEDRQDIGVSTMEAVVKDQVGAF